VLPLGPLTDELPEPMSREHFVEVKTRLRDAWIGHVTLEKRDVERLLNEIRWLRRRLQRVEEAIAPFVEEIRRIK